MKKFTLLLGVVAAATFAMATETVSYDHSSQKSSDVVHYDNRSHGRSDNVVHYDIRDGNAQQDAQKAQSR